LISLIIIAKSKKPRREYTLQREGGKKTSTARKLAERLRKRKQRLGERKEERGGKVNS